MSVIYKYMIPMDDQSHLVPGRVVHAAMNERNGMWVWSLIEDTHHTVEQRYQIYGTGHPLPKHALHVATCQDPPFVWHLIRYGDPLRIPKYTSIEGEASD